MNRSAANTLQGNSRSFQIFIGRMIIGLRAAQLMKSDD
jgi:hypothetical protein